MQKKSRLVCAGTLLLWGSYALARSSELLPISTVQMLYKDFSWERPDDATSKENVTLIEQPETVLRKYFTPELARLIFRDRQCVRRTNEICRLNFDPIWASQDPQAFDLKIEAGKKANEVSIRYRYRSNNELIRMKYDLVADKAGWRISDIHYQHGPSLVKMLRGNK